MMVSRTSEEYSRRTLVKADIPKIKKNEDSCLLKVLKTFCRCNSKVKDNKVAGASVSNDRRDEEKDPLGVDN
jgi:hypothetical protein